MDELPMQEGEAASFQLDPASPALDDALARAYASLGDPDLCKPDPAMGALLMKRHPYLFAPMLKAGEIHCNSDHMLEELSDEDMDLSIDFI